MDVAKRIADAVHGTVELSEAEANVLSTRAFQRLRGVKHLGLASLAFPGADYSRFSHGVGTLHVTGMIFENLKRYAPQLTDPEVRVYRMAALLHDIGHYPFSHTFERALKAHYVTTDIVEAKGDTGTGKAGTHEGPTGVWLHETVGANVISTDPELVEALANADIDGELMSRVIERDRAPLYSNLVSSDLDADRTDYLMRTAKHTGLPYGNVDFPYLLSQIRLDRDNKICFTRKGMRAAEHLLLCRYFDYQQVSYHKTVAGLELVLNDAVAALLANDRLACRPSDLLDMIADGRWYGFDDAHITSLMREALLDQPAGADSLLYESVLYRRPPKLVADRELLGLNNREHSEALHELGRLAREHKPQWEDDFGARFYIWQQNTTLMKIGSHIPISEYNVAAAKEEQDHLEQSVRILADDTSSMMIQEYPRSLMSVLADQSLFALRVYVLLPAEHEDRRDEITAKVNSDLGNIWKTK